MKNGKEKDGRKNYSTTLASSYHTQLVGGGGRFGWMDGWIKERSMTRVDGEEGPCLCIMSQLMTTTGRKKGMACRVRY